jgi:hypothetical protein
MLVFLFYPGTIGRDENKMLPLAQKMVFQPGWFYSFSPFL